jgi:DNA-binding NarL/FixJ family response regulator
MHSDATFGTEAFRAGVSGYVLKSSSGAESVAPIQEALGDESIFLRPLPWVVLRSRGSGSYPDRSGSRTVTVVPSPSRLSISMSPP